MEHFIYAKAEEGLSREEIRTALLESLAGRDVVMALIRKTAGKDLKVNDFPLEQSFLHTLRDAVNGEIKKYLAKKKRK